MAEKKGGIDLTSLVNTGISLVTGFVAGLFKGKVRGKIKELDQQANYAAALDQKNRSTLMVIYVLAAGLVILVVFLFIKRRRK